jgi:hypothetical protein
MTPLERPSFITLQITAGGPANLQIRLHIERRVTYIEISAKASQNFAQTLGILSVVAARIMTMSCLAQDLS